MTLLPIIERELRVKARRKGLRSPRVITAVVALLIVTWTVFVPQWWGLPMPPQAAVATCFSLLTLVAAFMGARLTADSVSEEYREQTLGLLLLSHLKGWEVATGKLMSNTVTAGYTLMATVPVLSIPLLRGGAEPVAVFKLALVMLNTLVLSAAIGLFFSSRTSDGRRAQTLATLLMAFLMFVLPSLVAMAAIQGPTSPWRWAALLCFLCPTLPIYGVFGVGMSSAFDLGGFWTFLGVQQGLAWLLVFAAGRGITRRSVDRPVGGFRLGWRQRWGLWRLGGTATRSCRRRRMLDRNPFEWLVCRYRWRAFWPLLLTGLPLAIFSALAVAFPDEVEPISVGLFVVVLMHVLLKFQMVSDSVVPLLTERREGTAELLLSTPLSNREFMAGQWGAMRSQFGPAVAVTLAATGVLAVLIFLDAERSTDLSRTVAFLLGLPAVGLLFDWWTLTWVGMWCATWRGTSRKAA
ncbi:MAG: ABC transporter permease subunit, partial [Verrucomicrobiae bacterium]|nr:ABC transporter permease subunit [Verrucomicrobiae bacterium]